MWPALDGGHESATPNGGHRYLLLILVPVALAGHRVHRHSRLLQLSPRAADGTVVLDFNRAVNLPCAYTDLATCPLPPAENQLPVAIEAGEKIPYERR